MKIPVTGSEIGRNTLVFMRSVLTSSSIVTKVRACAGNVRGVSGMNFHEDPCNRKRNRAKKNFGRHVKCLYFLTNHKET